MEAGLGIHQECQSSIDYYFCLVVEVYIAKLLLKRRNSMPLKDSKLENETSLSDKLHNMLFDEI